MHIGHHFFSDDDLGAAFFRSDSPDDDIGSFKRIAHCDGVYRRGKDLLPEDMPDATQLIDMVIINLHTGTKAQSSTGGIFAHGSGTEDDHLGRRYSGNASKNQPFAVNDTAHVLCCNEHAGVTRYLTHGTDDRHPSHLVLYVLIGDGSDFFLLESFDVFLLLVTDLQGRDEGLAGLEHFQLLHRGRFYFEHDIRLIDVFGRVNDACPCIGVFVVKKLGGTAGIGLDEYFVPMTGKHAHGLWGETHAMLLPAHFLGNTNRE